MNYKILKKEPKYRNKFVVIIEGMYYIMTKMESAMMLL